MTSEVKANLEKVYILIFFYDGFPYVAILWYFRGLVPWSDFPSVHWYHVLDRLLPGRSLRTVVVKIAWDQVLLGPCHHPVILAHMPHHLYHHQTLPPPL